MNLKILVTGGAGFIGSAVIRHIIQNTNDTVLNIDKLTYAGNLSSLDKVTNSDRYLFKQLDICDSSAMTSVFEEFQPNIVMHLAAESHVDRSIDGPSEFIKTNVFGTFSLLEAARLYWSALTEDDQKKFRFHHISTDEVYGDLETPEELFTENTPYAPSSPYSASKASSDHLVRAWHRTYSLPVVITNCSNNYGPYHFPEKLIPHIILNALSGRPLPIYGNGRQIRDWLYVEDHARALYQVASKGKVGQTYNIGGHNEMTNLSVVESICDLLEELVPEKTKCNKAYKDLIVFVEDRPGHDFRYAIDASKIENELDWKPVESFESGLRKTVIWYLENEKWWSSVLTGEYQLHRLGESN